MLSRLEIEELLKEELIAAKSRHEAAKTNFTLVCRESPGGLPHPDGTHRILKAGHEQSAALGDFMVALKRFNDFILHGKFPDNIAGR